MLKICYTALNTAKQVIDKKFLAFIIFFFFNILLINTQNIKSPVNNKVLSKKYFNSYSFFAGGHLYGYPSLSVFVAPSLLATIDTINYCKPDFFISLGDNFRKTDSINILNFKKFFANKLKCPMFISVGNHDVSNYSIYNNFFGNTYYAFYFENDFFIFLDSEIDNGEIKGKQLEFLKDKTEEIYDNQTVQNIFVLCHRLIWSTNDTTFKYIYENTNAVDGYPVSNNYAENVFPLLNKMAKNKNLYFLSGDIGVTLKDKRWGFPVFYYKLPTTNITYVANGIGDNEKDAILKIDVDEKGYVKFDIFPLTSYKWENIENYGIDFWKQYFKDKPAFHSKTGTGKLNQNNNVTFITKCKNIVKNKYFLYGIPCGLILALIIWFLFKKFK